MAAVGHDRTARELRGLVAKIVWSNKDEERPFLIARLEDGTSICGSAADDEFTSGQQYRFHGRWKDGKYGPEFVFETYTVDRPLSRTAVVKYLAKFCRHIGEATAKRMFDKFGPDAVELLRADPAKIADAGFLSSEHAAEASDDLGKADRFEKTKIELFGLFKGRGFPARSLIRSCIRIWGAAAYDAVISDPFSMLVRKLHGASFRRCDKLYTELGLPLAALKRQALCAWSLLRDDRSGSIWIESNVIATQMTAIIREADPYKALILLRRSGWIRVRRDGEKRWIALRENAEAEQRIADSVRRLRGFEPLWPTTSVPVSQHEGDGKPSQHQVDELAKATDRAVGCFIGGPGTGKTHTLSFLLAAAVEEYGEAHVAVVAPTGKAASRAGESLRSRGLSIMATTIHRLLEIGRNGHDGGGWGFTRNRRRPIVQQMVVVDESSMIDCSLLADLLDAIPDGGSVLFVGDPGQLPPVGAGAPLRDFIAAGLPVGELTETRRNSGSIVRVCGEIRSGLPVRGDERFDLDAEDSKNLRVLDCSSTSRAIDALTDTVRSLTRFDAFETQVITALNDKSDVSRKKLNALLGPILNPDGYAASGNPYRVGDKIICLRNTFLQNYELFAIGRRENPDPTFAFDAARYSATGKDDVSYVANGEIGRVVAVSADRTIVRFGGMESALVGITNKKKRETHENEADAGLEEEAGGAFDLAWAITVHRSQGSEWPLVIVMVDENGSQIADRNFWYTAISRARKACLVIGSPTVLDRQIRRISLNQRLTFLTELLVNPTLVNPTPVPVQGEPHGDSAESEETPAIADVQDDRLACERSS